MKVKNFSNFSAMKQFQVFHPPEGKKLPSDLILTSLEETSEEQAENIEKLLEEMQALIVDSQELLDRLSLSE